MATRIAGGAFGSSTAFAASCRAASPPGFSAGGGWASKNCFTAGDGAATGVNGPVAAGASYQNLPPERYQRRVAGSCTTNIGVFTARRSEVPGMGCSTGLPA